MLIAARAVQGLGTGGLSALTQVILGDIVPPRERRRYSGYVGAVFGISTVAGPLLGGFIVDTDWLGWRWCFYVCVPLAIVAFAVVQRVLRFDHESRDARIDWWGATTLTGGATALDAAALVRRPRVRVELRRGPTPWARSPSCWSRGPWWPSGPRPRRSCRPGCSGTARSC